jgi:hypothetical protein
LTSRITKLRPIKRKLPSRGNTTSKTFRKFKMPGKRINKKRIRNGIGKGIKEKNWKRNSDSNKNNGRPEKGNSIV